MSNYGYVYERINEKFNNGTFNGGEDYSFNYYYEGHISEYSMEERTPEVCSSLMSYGRCSIDDVPKESITREFLINAFTNDGVRNYIISHINEFDKQFWLDLIVSNKYSTHFKDNCFEIMPIEFIDEEMCSLAMIKTMTWSSSDWFESTFRRKPKALTKDIWKLAARVYTKLAKFFIENVPSEYVDEEFYLEFLSCSFNCGISLNNDKRSSMDLIPQEVLTSEFLLTLILYSKDRKYNVFANLEAFNEQALETKIVYNGEEISIWKYAILVDPTSIQYIPLNEERNEFFLSKNDKDTIAYSFYFKKKYKEFLKKHNSNHLQAQQRDINNNQQKGLEILCLSMLGKSIDDALDSIDEVKTNTPVNKSLLPIYYKGFIPEKFRKEYDSEEYLLKVYSDFGIKVLGEYDSLFYDIILPKNWTIKRDGYWNKVIDDNGNTKIEFFYDSKFYDKDAYVREIKK